VGDQELIREVAGDLLDVCFDARARSERKNIARAQVDPMSLPVLVTALFPKEHDRAVVVRPYDPGTKIAIRDLGERARSRGFPHVGYPQIQHAVDRGEKGDAASVGTESYD
jgi:hypothetical protein